MTTEIFPENKFTDNFVLQVLSEILWNSRYQNTDFKKKITAKTFSTVYILHIIHTSITIYWRTTSMSPSSIHCWLYYVYLISKPTAFFKPYGSRKI